MLQTMRHLAQSWIFKGLMSLLIVSFGIWGVGDVFRGNALQRTVAKAGSTSITVQSLNRAFEETLSRARQMMGPDLTAQQAKQMGLMDEALNSLIARAEVDQDIKRLGLDVSEKVLIDQLAAQPQLRDKDGKFNQALFRQLLQREGKTFQGFLDEGRQELARGALVDLFSTSKPPALIIDDMYKARGQKRILDVITLKNDSFNDIAAPDEKILRDFYQKNGEKFTAPEYRAITLARLSVDEVAKDITITDDQLKKEYDAKGDQLTQPERRDILQVVVQSEDKAKQLATAAKANSNLADTAKDMGYKAIPFNQTDEKSLLSELAKPAFSLQLKQVSEPIKSALGWHVIQVKKITAAGKPAFKDIKDQMRETMLRDQSVETATRMVNQMDDELAAGHTLEDIADSMKLRLIKIPAIDATGKTPDGKAPAELPAKDDVLKASFGQNNAETSPIMDDKNGHYTIVRTDDITPSAVKPFDKVKTEILAAWKAQEQAAQATAAAEKMAQALRDGKPASSFADQDGVDVRVSKPISLLNDKDPSLPASATAQILRMKKGDVITTAQGNHQFVLRLVKTIDVDATAKDAPKGPIISELNANSSHELQEEYLNYLHVLFPVEINHDLLETLTAQGSN